MLQHVPLQMSKHFLTSGLRGNTVFVAFADRNIPANPYISTSSKAEIALIKQCITMWFTTFILFLNTLIVNGQSKKFDELLTAYNKDHNFNGVVLVATDGKIDYLGAIGLSDRDKKTQFSPQARFKIASMTKVFTAILVMKLVEEGKIDLQEKIGKYLPTYKGEGKEKVTIHQLLTYSSGIENRAEPLGMEPYRHAKTLDQFIDEYCSGKLVNVPGEKSIYGNTEYILLQKIVENVTKKPFREFLSQTIIKPLKLSKTGIVDSRKTENTLAKSYVYDEQNSSLTPDEPYFVENYFAAGNMYSSAEDLLTLSNALFGYKILNEATTKKMLEINDKLGYTAYGLWGSDGWGNFDEKFYYRTGGILGSTSNWITTLGTHKTIIVLSNTDATNLYELSEKLYLASKQ